ncbi:energy-coupling factor ABC transporter substrate-binding protein [Pseudoduganella sp. S-14]|jgi:cobalt/nickel transport protein|uniref:energy-coupling factor ABC transporter substrate-binding protein n=1 Tax=Pseudoduganella sp. S-14 TaxID=3404065 RepID=UPI003CEF3799
MKARTGLIWMAIILLTVLPLWFAAMPPAEPGGEAPAAFSGADSRAQQAIGTIAPNYKPWFAPLFEPPSGEIASLLFALQAAIGAGVIGFWLGTSVARERERRCAPGASVPEPDSHAD